MKKGFSLIELMLVVLIFTFLFAATLTVLTSQDRSWREGYKKLAEQQEARKAMDIMVRLLRESSPQYGVTIGAPEQNRILFYKPFFNEAGAVINTHWIIFKLDPNNPRQLIKREEGGDWVAIAQEVESIKFYGGDCVSCGCFTLAGCSNCLSVTNNCPIVKIEIQTKTQQGFTLASYATLRNTNSLSEAPEPPPEGEF